MSFTKVTPNEGGFVKQNPITATYKKHFVGRPKYKDNVKFGDNVPYGGHTKVTTYTKQTPTSATWTEE